MSSSIEEQFDPPEWATREEVIKAGRHYINYWRIEAQTRNGQWLETMSENARLKAEVERLTAFTTRTIIPNEVLQAQVERLTKAGDAMLSEWSSGDETDANNFRKALVIWNAAKEGKQP